MVDLMYSLDGNGIKFMGDCGGSPMCYMSLDPTPNHLYCQNKQQIIVLNDIDMSESSLIYAFNKKKQKAVWHTHSVILLFELIVYILYLYMWYNSCILHLEDLHFHSVQTILQWRNI